MINKQKGHHFNANKKLFIGQNSAFVCIGNACGLLKFINNVLTSFCSEFSVLL